MVVWELPSTQTWALQNFTVLSLVNPSSSVNRILATNCALTMHFYWQNTTLAQWSGGVGICTHWMCGNTDAFSSYSSSHWFWNLPPPFSVCKLSYQELELIKALHNLTPMEQRTQIHWVTGEVWWLICGMRFCIVANVLHRGKILPKNFQWHSRTWN